MLFRVSSLLLAVLAHTVLAHEKGAVASESAVCSRVGVDLIKEGGNAADAVSSHDE